MARLPDPAELTRVTPQPARGVVSVNTGIASSADIDAARARQSLAREMEQTARAEIVRLDELKVTDAETQLMRAEMELEAEYQQVKNQDVMTPDFHKNFQEKYRLAKDAATRGLVTPAQKARFEQVSKRRAVGFDARRTAYAMGEAERAQDAIFQSRIEVLSQKGADTYRDPSAFQAASTELEDFYVKEMTRRGIADPAVLTAGLQKIRSQFYATTIERAFENNDTTHAANLYTIAASTNMLTPEQRRVLGAQVQTAQAFDRANTIAAEVLELERANTDPAEVEMYIRTAAGNTATLNATQALLTDIRQRQEVTDRRASGAIVRTFQEGGMTFGAMQKAMKTPEWANLREDQRNKLFEDMTLDARATQTFNLSMAREARARQAEKYDTLENYARMLEITESPRFKDMDPAELMGYKYTIGEDLVKVLFKQQAAIKAEAKTREGEAQRFRIDTDILNAAIPAELLKSGNKDKLYAFKGLVEVQLQKWKDANPGKVPSLEEQRTIARAGLAEYKVKGRFYGENTYPAYELPRYRGAIPEAETKRAIIAEVIARTGREPTPEQVDEIFKRYSQTQ